MCTIRAEGKFPEPLDSEKAIKVVIRSRACSNVGFPILSMLTSSPYEYINVF